MFIHIFRYLNFVFKAWYALLTLRGWQCDNFGCRDFSAFNSLDCIGNCPALSF